MNLYEISNEYIKVFDTLSEMESLDDVIISDTLNPLTKDFNDKAIKLTYYFKNLEANSLAIKEAEKNMCLRRKSIDKKIENLKGYLKNEMIRTGINKIDCPYFSVRISKSKQSVDVIDENLVPNNFKIIKEIITCTIDKESIRKAGGCDGALLKDTWSLTFK